MIQLTILHIVFGAALILTASLILFNVRRRKFNRRNAMGVEVYRSYTQMAGARSMDMLLSVVGWLFFAAGAFCIVKGVLKL